jgi:hypothetical protein
MLVAAALPLMMNLATSGPIVLSTMAKAAMRRLLMVTFALMMLRSLILLIRSLISLFALTMYSRVFIWHRMRVFGPSLREAHARRWWRKLRSMLLESPRILVSVIVIVASGVLAPIGGHWLLTLHQSGRLVVN